MTRLLAFRLWLARWLLWRTGWTVYRQRSRKAVLRGETGKGTKRGMPRPEQSGAAPAQDHPRESQS